MNDVRNVNDPESMVTITIWKDMESVRPREASPEYREVLLAAASPFIVGLQSVSLCEVKTVNAAGLVALPADGR